MATDATVFVSYARADAEEVGRITDRLRARGIDLWMDVSNLVAGVSWTDTIEDALRNSTAILAFVSPASLASNWVLWELEAAIRKGTLVIPVLLGNVDVRDLPLGLQRIHHLNATRRQPEAVATEIANALLQMRPKKQKEQQAVLEPGGAELARALAEQSKAVAGPSAEAAPDSIFIVHGHDDDFLLKVVAFLRELAIQPIVLRDIGGSSRSLLDRFFEVGAKARFAMVLLSADDFGAARIQYEHPGVGERALKYRARQNVLLELGFFYGLLGWDRVFVLEKAAALPFPDFERPSDLAGVVFERFDVGGEWRGAVRNRLFEAGFRLTKA